MYHEARLRSKHRGLRCSGNAHAGPARRGFSLLIILEGRNSVVLGRQLDSQQHRSANTSRSIKRTEVKQLLVINDSDLQMIKKAYPTNNVYREVLRFGEIRNGIPLEIANCQSHLVAISVEVTGSSADSFPYTSL